MEFQEKYKHNVVMSTGSTAGAYTPYYSMQDYNRIDFVFNGLVKLPSSGALGATDYQKFTLAAYQASNSTGGGSSALATATAITGVDGAASITTAVKCREGRIYFSTIADDAALTINVGSAAYISATSGSAAMYFACAASAAATVAAQGFVTMFNSTANNTATAITANWYAATDAAGVAWVKILPVDPDGTHLLTMNTTGSSQIGLGGVFSAHIGIDRQFMGEGKTHIALNVKSTEHGNHYAVNVFREAVYQPVKSVTVSKSINASTSK